PRRRTAYHPGDSGSPGRADRAGGSSGSRRSRPGRPPLSRLPGPPCPRPHLRALPLPAPARLLCRRGGVSLVRGDRRRPRRGPLPRLLLLRPGPLLLGGGLGEAPGRRPPRPASVHRGLPGARPLRWPLGRLAPDPPPLAPGPPRRPPPRLDGAPEPALRAGHRHGRGRRRRRPPRTACPAPPLLGRGARGTRSLLRQEPRALPRSRLPPPDSPPPLALARITDIGRAG